MDLVSYDEKVFEKIRLQYLDIASKLDVQDILFIPISAKFGDNIVKRSVHTSWYDGPTLMYLLETIHIASDYNNIDARFPVQYVIRPNSAQFHDYRGYAGRIAGGCFRKGDVVKVLPSGYTSKIKSIDTITGSLDMAFAPQSVTICLEDNIDISRGDMLVRENNQPLLGQDIDMMICWFNEKPMRLNGKYLLKHSASDSHCIIKDVKYKININTLDRISGDKNIGLNEIGRISIRSTKPLLYDPYRKNRITGSVILIDKGTNETVCAGMIV
jgi:sulfate adenylyltransferase subunit 1